MSTAGASVTVGRPHRPVGRASAALLLWLHAPAALMLGPLVAAIVVASGGGKVRLPLAAFVWRRASSAA